MFEDWPEKGFTLAEEIAHALSHGLGVILSGVALGILLFAALFSGQDWAVFSVLIFGISLILLYLFSALYHAIPHHAIKYRLHMLDHCAIFVLIAGSYTPFALLGLGGTMGWLVFALIWSLAGCGILLRVAAPLIFARVSLLLYLLMGWIGIFFAQPVAESLGGAAWFILAGGLVYTGGVIFYLWNKLPFNHAIWHVMVMIGSGLHVCAVYYTLQPTSLIAA